MISDNNQPTNFPSINLLKNISRAQGLIRFITENQQDHLLETGEMTALDALRDATRALSTAQDDLNELLDEHRDEKHTIMSQAFPKQ
jgi:hypothetical protein